MAKAQRYTRLQQGVSPRAILQASSMLALVGVILVSWRIARGGREAGDPMGSAAEVARELESGASERPTLVAASDLDPRVDGAEAAMRRVVTPFDSHFSAEIEVSTVDAASAAPVADVRVQVESWPFFEDDGRVQVVSGRTDAAGRILLRVPLGRVVVSAVHGSDGIESLASASATLVSPERVSLQLELQRGCVVRGLVLDAATGSPIHGAAISNELINALRSGPSLSDEQGRFTLSPWRMGLEAGVVVTASGYGVESAFILVEEDGSWRVPARFGIPAQQGGSSPFLEVRLVPERIIRGVLVGQDGPVEGGSASADGLLLFSKNVGQADRAEAVTGSSGEFVLRGLRPDITQTVWVQASELAPQQFLVEPGSMFVDLGTITLSPGAAIIGIVADEQGNFVPGVSLSIRTGTPKGALPVDADPRDGDNRHRDGYSRPAPFSRSMIADAEGSFRFEALPAGELVLEAQVERSSLGRRTIVLRPGETVLLEEPIVVGGGRQTITGRVLVSPPAPEPPSLEGLILQLSDPVLGRVSQARSDAEGGFRIWGLRKGETYALRLLRENRALWRGTASLEDEPLLIELSEW